MSTKKSGFVFLCSSHLQCFKLKANVSKLHNRGKSNEIKIGMTFTLRFLVTFNWGQKKTNNVLTVLSMAIHSTKHTISLLRFLRHLENWVFNVRSIKFCYSEIAQEHHLSIKLKKPFPSLNNVEDTRQKQSSKLVQMKANLSTVVLQS